MGEYTAMAFYPIIALGMWSIYNDNAKVQCTHKRKVMYLIIGMLGILFCHILSIEMGIIVLLCIIAVEWKKTVKQETLMIFSEAAAFAVVFFYGMLIDAEGASVRAIVMFSLRLLAQVLQRTYDLPTALSLAAVLLLCREPFYVRDAGFLFSFTAALSLGVFSPLFALSETGIRQETGLLPHNFTRSKKKARPAKIQKGSVRKEQNALPSTHQDTLPNALQKVRERLENARLRFLQAAVKSLSACVCAVVFTMPVHMQYMYTFPVYAVFLNLLVLPLMGVTLFLGLLLLPLALLAEALIRVAEAFPLLSFAAAVFRAAARIAAFLLHLLYAFFAGLCRTSEGLPFARLVTGRAQGWQIVAFYAALLFLYLLCGRVRLRAAWRYLWILAAALLLFFRPASGLRLTVLSVGQGDGICIKSREATMFIDGGSSSKSALSEYTLLPFFLSEGIDRLDALFITHWDADHYNGILRLLSEEENALPHIEALCLPDTGGALHTEGYEKIMTAAERFHIPVYFLKEGDALNKGALSLHVLSPTAGYVSDDINEYSLVLRLCYGDFCALFTGDITGEAENALMEKAGRVDFLKVAHHGSAYSTPEALLQALSPKICAISVGAGNRYGHPASALLKRLAESGAAVYRTDTQGAICLRLPYARQKPYAAESAPDKAYMWQDAVKQKKVEIFGYLE